MVPIAVIFSESDNLKHHNTEMTHMVDYDPCVLKL